MPSSPRIGLHISPSDAFWVLVRESVYQCAHNLDISLVDVDLVIGDILTADERAGLLEEILAQDLKALISAYLPHALIEDVLAAEQPLILLSESGIRHPIFTSVTGLFDGAYMVGEYLASRLPEESHLVMVGGPKVEGQLTHSRASGLKAALEHRPHIQLHTIPCPWEPNQASLDIRERLMNLDVPIDAIFALSDPLALVARDIYAEVKPAGGRPLIAGINGDPLALSAIVDGSMIATVETPAAEYARQASELAARAAHGEALPAQFRIQPRLITATNVVDAMQRKMMAMVNLPTYFIGVSREQEKQRMRHLETSLEINRRVGLVLSRQQFSEQIADLIRASCGYDTVQVYWWSESESALIPYQPAGVVNRLPSISLNMAGLLRQAIMEQQAIFVPDAQHSLRFPLDPEYPETRSRLVLPIRLGDKTLGVLDLHSQHSTQHSKQEVTSLQLLADQLGIAMLNADLYEEALQARATAEKADRLKTRLLANVSHELRTPLNVVIGYSQSALASPNPYKIALPNELKRDLGHIYNSAEHLMRLVNDLLDLSRAEIDELSLVREPIALISFLKDVFNGFTGSLEQRHVRWLLQLPEDLPVIQADPVRLRQVLFNLLANARHYTRTGYVALGAEISPPHVHIWVEDSGIGIPVDQQEKVFEPFVTIEGKDRRAEGVGLGLAVTRRLVALHGGSMTLQSQVGHGSTFNIYLPIPSLAGPVGQIPPHAEAVLLLISSSGTMPDSVSKLCQERNLTIQHVQNKLDMADLLSVVQPAVVAWDYTSAYPEDWALIEQLRAYPQLSELPFILYDRVEASSSPQAVTSVVTKPVRFQTLMDQISAIRPANWGGPVLIVDDDQGARELYTTIVEQALPGQRIRVAENGIQALQALDDEIPSLVVLDLNMPGVDGFTVLQRLRTRRSTQRVPVLVVSGRLLSTEDLHHLDFSRVTFHSKGLYSQNETIKAIRDSLDRVDPLPQATSIVVKKVIRLIQEHFAEDLSREDIAREVGVSKGYLSEIFCQETGLSLREYWLRYRIREAKSRLFATSTPISDIAAQVGFDDPAHFSRVFKHLAGMSPRAFREQCSPSKSSSETW